MSAGFSPNVFVLVDDKAVQRALARLTSANLTDLLKNVGSAVEYQTRKRIAITKLDPNGDRWKPWSDAYQLKQDELWAASKAKYERKNPGRKARRSKGLLFQSGSLYDDIKSHTWGRNLIVGSNLVYASTHQYGSRRRNKSGEQAIPPRPYLGLSTADKAAIRKLTKAFLKGLLQK